MPPRLTRLRPHPRNSVARRALVVGAALLALTRCTGTRNDPTNVTTDFSLESTSPATLVAGGSVDVTVTATCARDLVIDLNWIDGSGTIIPGAQTVSGVVAPVVSVPSTNFYEKFYPLACDFRTVNANGDAVASTTLRFFASDVATIGRQMLRMRGFGRRRPMPNRSDDPSPETEFVDIDLDVVPPVAPTFSFSVPPQVSFTPGAAGLDVPVAIQRAGYAGPVSLSWQPLTLGFGIKPDTLLGGVRVVGDVADGVNAGTVRVEGAGIALAIGAGTLRTVLLRARGGTTERAALVRLLPNASAPAAPTSFRATPDVTSIGLAWDPAASLLTYRLEREAGAGTWDLVSATIPGTDTRYTDTGRAPDTPYSYRLSATNVNGTSPFATLSTRTLPTPPPPGNTGWQQLGPAVSSNSDVEPQPSVLVDGSGRVVVAYRYRSPTGLSGVIVKRYDFGGFWALLGAGPLNSTLSDGFSPSMAIDAAGVIYVAWTEYTGVSQRLYVSRFTSGSAWESVVPGNQPVDVLGAAASRPAIVVLPSGAPVVAWVQGGSIQVRTLTGGAWTLPAGGSGFTATTAYDVRLRLDGSTPVVAWAEGVGAGNALHVARGTAVQDGFTFSAVGGAANATPPSGSPSINFFDIVPTGGTDYLVYAQGSTGFTIRARYFSGGSWFDYGAPIVVNNADELIGVGAAADPFTVAWSSRPVNQAFGSVFSVSHITQNGWAPLTPNFGDTWIAAPNGLSMRMASTQSPLVANGVQVGDSYELRVRQYFQP